MARILVLSADQHFSRNIKKALQAMGYKAHTSHVSLEPFLGGADHYDMAILDIDIFREDHRHVFYDLMQYPSPPETLVVTDSDNPEFAEESIRKGAWDCFKKPPPWEMLEASIQRAAKKVRNNRNDEQLVLERCGIAGSSPGLMQCLHTVHTCAATDSNVLIFGETGTGKELFARAIHCNSLRREFPIITVDCACLTESLVESTLFGHEKGAFTTADRKHPGLLKQAHKGTLFLDEVGELPMTTQKTFLRVLQERRFRPVGSTTEMFSDFRLVAATNKNLDQMAAEGQFREDLLHRLKGISLHIPPLRCRQSDIKTLVYHYLNNICHRYGIELKSLSDEVLDIMTRYPWPGNVRELISKLEHAVIMGLNETYLLPEHLPTSLRVQKARQQFTENTEQTSITSPTAETPEDLPDLKEYRNRVLADLEKDYLRKLMRVSRDNIQKACQTAGLSRSRLYALLKKYGYN